MRSPERPTRLDDLKTLGIDTGNHESFAIGILAESERKNLQNVFWFAETNPWVFCSRKSAVFTYAILERSWPTELIAYTDFLRNFTRGSETSKRTAWAIIALLSERKGVQVDIPEDMAPQSYQRLENPVIPQGIAKIVKTVSTSTGEALDPSKRRIGEAYVKRLWRRYLYLQENYRVKGSGEVFEEQELSRELFGFMQAHISGNRAQMEMPKFESMGATLEDSLHGMALYFVMLRKYADSGFSLSAVRKWLEWKKAERFDSEGYAYARFFLKAVNDADERRGAESIKIRDAREELQHLQKTMLAAAKRVGEILATLSQE